MKTFQNFFVLLICVGVLFVFQSESVVANTMNCSNGDEVQSANIIQATGRISKVTPQRGAMYKVYILVEDNGNLPSEIEIGLQRYVKTSAARLQSTAISVLGARPSNSDPQSTAVSVLGATIDKLAKQGTNVVIYETARPQRTTRNGLKVGDTKEIKLSSNMLRYTFNTNNAAEGSRPLPCAITVCGDWGCMCKLELDRPW